MMAYHHRPHCSAPDSAADQDRPIHNTKKDNVAGGRQSPTRTARKLLMYQRQPVMNPSIVRVSTKTSQTNAEKGLRRWPGNANDCTAPLFTATLSLWLNCTWQITTRMNISNTATRIGNGTTESQSNYLYKNLHRMPQN